MHEADISLGGASLDAMGIGELLALTRAAGLRDVEELSCHGTGAVLQIDVGARYDEAALSGLDAVDEWTHVAETDDGHLYVVEFTAPALPRSLDETSEDLLGTCDPQIGEASVGLSLTGPQQSIADTISAYEAAGVSTELRTLGPYEGASEPLDELTDRQREVLQTAFDMGYFEVPRAVSAAEIADELGLDQSTVVEHLQRAERNLLGQVL